VLRAHFRLEPGACTIKLFFTIMYGGASLR